MGIFSKVLVSKPASTVTWPLFPRQVKFDWQSSPFHWIPNDPFASHAVNHFSFSLVRGEYFFCRIFNKALPEIHDEKLLADVKTFIRQEAIHAQAHKEAIEQYLQRYDVDAAANYARVVKLFDTVLADKPFGYTLPKALQKEWLLIRVAIVAAAEHFTAGFGHYVLTNSHWEARGADPIVSDLFTWHSAEEVEHRTVAFDLYQHLSGNYLRRSFIMLGMVPIFTYFMAAGTAKLIQYDSSMPHEQRSLMRRGFWKAWANSAKNHRVPGPLWFPLKALSFFKPDYDPFYEASTELALNYINQSSGVLAAQRRVKATEGKA
ncbi:hypothetical protein F966_03160 [Acinetobacter higginsii]|uniref:Metal-dependent hydrolase n=1 Tax=Acinetobacter higginsii TaxID=70347 RepID=N8W960_9GAMM|nr:metal-dependent hydrolase [Acinetobacter higginsii]ENV08486.1 hypothetical protein F966_03160 [Acinetobacter higginsii]